MRTFGLIGFPLTHSFSQKYFSEKFKRENINDAEFKNFPLENVNDFPKLIENNPSLRGLSVTIPHKQNVVKFLNEIGDVAKEVGAVNCIKISKAENGKVKTEGFNTDAYGFEKSFKPMLKPHHNRVLILGTGGAAQAVKFVLEKNGFKYYFVSRSSGNVIRDGFRVRILGFNISESRENLIGYAGITKSVLKEYNIIVNTTPVGMFPDADTCPPIPYDYLTEKHLLYDLVYNPEETLFLKKGKEKGAQIKNGLEMLQLQADKAWEIWNNYQ